MSVFCVTLCSGKSTKPIWKWKRSFLSQTPSRILEQNDGPSKYKIVPRLTGKVEFLVQHWLSSWNQVAVGGCSNLCEFFSQFPVTIQMPIALSNDAQIAESSFRILNKINKTNVMELLYSISFKNIRPAWNEDWIIILADN